MKTTLSAALACCALVPVGCADDGAPPLRDDDDDSSTTMVETESDTLTTTTDSTSDTTTSETGTTGDAVAPEITDIDITGNPLSVLSASIEVTTDVETTITVTMTPDGGDAIELGFDSPAGSTHTFPVLGMHAESDYTFEVTVESTASGLTASDTSLTFTTEALPADLPPIEAQVDDPDAVQPGVVIFDVARWEPGVSNDYGWVVALDEAGEVVWYFQDSERVQDVKAAADGSLWLMNVTNDTLKRIDMMGNELFSVTAESLGVDSFHHEVIELPNGNIVTLGSELENIDGYDDGMMGTVAYDVVADTIIEISPEGELVDEITMFDLYDPLNDFREPLFSNPFWDNQYPEAMDGTKDWTHGNAVIYDEDDDAYIVSLRHILCLAKVSRATGELVWSLGENRDFALVGNGAWQYGQHAPEFQEDGSMLVYDNGNLRPLGMGESNYSRVVQYTIDETNMEVTQDWAYQLPFYTPFLGDADRMANGNILVGAGGRLVDETLPVGNTDNRKFAQLIEITGDANPTVVSTITFSDESTMDPFGYSIYRAEKLPSLYQVE